MPLLRGIARTAVIAGTATAVSNRVSRRQEGRWAQQEQQQQMAAQAPPQPVAAPVHQDDPMERLKQLAQLHDSGVLTDEEFATAKAKILNA
jgi:hypothetical protein